MFIKYVILVIRKADTKFETTYIRNSPHKVDYDLTLNPEEAFVTENKNLAEQLAKLWKGHVITRQPTQEPKPYWWDRD